MDRKEAPTQRKKPTLLSMRLRTPFSTEQIATLAGVSLREAYVVEIGGFAHTDVAQKVIEAFTRLSGIPCTLDDIRLHNVPPTQPENHSRYKKEWSVLP